MSLISVGWVEPGGIRRSFAKGWLAIPALLLLLGCDGAEAVPDLAAGTSDRRSGGEDSTLRCSIAAGDVSALPDELRESSGLAASRATAGLFWSHNDAGNRPILFAVGEDGAVLSSVTVEDGGMTDWEDIESAPCGDGECLYLADIGDNDGDRDEVRILRITEPSLGADRVRPEVVLRARYPGDPLDAESLFVLDGRIFLVTKGRRSDVALYEVPPTAGQREPADLERIATLMAEPDDERDRVTGATASRDGRWVAVRTYRKVLFYPARELVDGANSTPLEFDIGEIHESQGEGITFDANGRIWLSSEAERDDDRPLIASLMCDLPDP